MTRLDLYKSLFRGREDIFALRWEKGKKAGYRPEYKSLLHKAAGSGQECFLRHQVGEFHTTYPRLYGR